MKILKTKIGGSLLFEPPISLIISFCNYPLASLNFENYVFIISKHKYQLLCHLYLSSELHKIHPQHH
jgi:hypothetical protein